MPRPQDPGRGGVSLPRNLVAEVELAGRFPFLAVLLTHEKVGRPDLLDVEEVLEGLAITQAGFLRIVVGEARPELVVHAGAWSSRLGGASRWGCRDSRLGFARPVLGGGGAVEEGHRS